MFGQWTKNIWTDKTLAVTTDWYRLRPHWLFLGHPTCPLSPLKKGLQKTIVSDSALTLWSLTIRQLERDDKPSKGINLNDVTEAVPQITFLLVTVMKRLMKLWGTFFQLHWNLLLSTASCHKDKCKTVLPCPPHCLLATQDKGTNNNFKVTVLFFYISNQWK